MEKDSTMLRKSSFKSGSKSIDQLDMARYAPMTSSWNVCSKIRLQALEKAEGSSIPIMADDNSLPTSTYWRWVIGSWLKMILFLLICDMYRFTFSLPDIWFIKEGLPSDVSTGDQALFTSQESPLFLIRPFLGIWWSLLSNIHSSLSKRRRQSQNLWQIVFSDTFCLHFAKQNEKVL